MIMSEIILRSSELAPTRLTEILVRGGHMTNGTVDALTVSNFKSFFADFYSLNIQYSADASPSLPDRMIMKVPFVDNPSALAMGRDEVAGYMALTGLVCDLPTVRCFDARVDKESGTNHLLLEDLSKTHVRGDSPDDIPEHQWKLCVESLADLHSFWWESEALGNAVGHIPTEADLVNFEALNRESLPKFYSALADEPLGLRSVYERVADRLVDYWNERLTSSKRNTLIHGDAHSWNFLFPRAAKKGRVFMIDLATLRVRPATNDLAYLMALKWRPERRKRYERLLLEHYHDALVERGVKDYSRGDCFLDYRYSVLTHLFTPVVQCAVGFLSQGIWRANFERIYAAFHDLNCEELV